MDRLASEANRVLNHPGLNGNYGWRGSLWNIPGTDAANAAALIDTLKTQSAFTTLQDMRNASKTGGALGAVSDRENAMLQEAIASLNKSQSVEQVRENLSRIIKFTEQSKERIASVYNDHWNASGQSARQPQGANKTPTEILGEARAAINAGAPRDKVIDRLRQMGLDAGGL